MKDLDMMHYFLGMKVSHNVDGISLGQKMMDHKAMATPMASNLKLLSDASSELIDAKIYRQIIRWCFSMGSGVISCFSKNNSYVALSIVEE